MTDRKRRLTPAEWAKAQVMYKSGEYTLDDIAKKFGVHAVTVQRHMSRHKIEKGATVDKIEKAAEEEVESAVKREAAVLTRRIQETKEETYRINQAVDKRMIRELVLADQEGRQIATALPNLKALKILAETAKLTREARYEILGITAGEAAEDELPTLEVREMLEEEIAAVRDGQQRQAEEMGLEK